MQISIREARQQLSRLLKAVEQGEMVEITRRGRVVAQLSPPSRSGNKAELRATARANLRASQSPARTSSPELIREMRDERG
jgi:prevent-host-death family protein